MKTEAAEFSNNKESSKVYLLITKTYCKAMQLTYIFHSGSRTERYLTQNILRVMRLTTILLLAASLHVTAKTEGQNVTLKVKNAPISKVFQEIQKQTKLDILVDAELLQKTGTVTLDVHNMPVSEVLSLCLKNEPLTYTFVGKRIVISAIPTPDLSRGVISLSSFLPPPIDIHGHVTDSLGNPLAGVSVTVKGATKGTSTDANGNFTLYGVNDNASLIISIVGFEPQQLKIKGKNQLAISLKQHSTSLLDVEVTKGYYNTTNRLNTGDITTVSGADINKQPVSDPIMALEGRVPGLYIQQYSGAPGAYSTVQIRGQNSIANGNDPLYMVDGVPFSSESLSSTAFNAGPLGYTQSNSNSNQYGAGISPFNALNPADIESVTILKDADATAIYGSRGANGVILITTKHGKSGNTHVDVNVFTGTGEVTRSYHMLNTPQYLQMRREAFLNEGLPVPSIVTDPTDVNYDVNGFWDTTRYTDWQKLLIGNMANFTNAQASVSGGTANTQFVFGGGYSNQGTVFAGSYSDQKISGHLSLTHSSADQRFHLQVGANYVYDDDNLPSSDFTNSITLAPDAPALYEKNGNLNWQELNGTFTFLNPIASTYSNFKSGTNNFISNLNLGYEILPGLQLKSSFGFNSDQLSQVDLYPATVQPPPYNTQSISRANYFATTTGTSWIIEPQLNYSKRIGQGRVEALLGATFQSSSRSTSAVGAYGFASDILIVDPQAAAYTYIAGSNSSLYRYSAIYGRVGYNWSDKYLINLTARRDGSSRFGPGKQFGNFGALGLGWIFTKEAFAQKSLSFLSFGKLRGSYGITGNDQISDYQFLSTYSPNSNSLQGVNGLSPNGLTNPYFAWEVVKKLEGGIDLGLIKDRLLLSAVYFRNRTGNQLVGYPLPGITGFNTVQYNLPAVVQNTGAEFTVNTTNIKTKTFTWTTAFNLSIPSNKLISFPGLENSAYNGTYVVGKSLFIREVFHSTGVDPQTGLYSFSAKDGSGVPSFPQDVVATKPITQQYYGGFGNNFTYKGFSLDIFFQFVKQLGYNYKTYFRSPGVFNYNEPTAVLNRWQTPGDMTTTQRFGTDGSTAGNVYGTFTSSDGVITDASFIRLKNLALSYQLPTQWKRKLSMQGGRLYIQCQNLFTITHYLGDPEVPGLTLPPLRMITGGIQVNF